jgi:hypothetical protein
MIMPKEMDAMNDRSANWQATQHASGSAGVAEAVASSNIKPEPVQTPRRPFFEDFNLEHSVQRAAIAAFTISAGTNPLESAARRSSHAQEFAAPNCVFLG